MLLIDAIAHVESAGNNVPGDAGAAVSIFQIHREAWADVRTRYGIDRAGDMFLDVGDRFEDISLSDLTSRMRARNCATGYVFLLQERLKRAGQSISPQNIYACWNLGFDGFRKAHFQLAHCPKRTAFKALRVAELMRPEHAASPAAHD